MTGDLTAFTGADIFDGASIQSGQALLVRGSVVEGCVATGSVPADAQVVSLNGGILAPGYVDLQVNGGGGVMFGDDPSIETLERIARAHASLGATSILPTLITDTPKQVRAAIAAAIRATEHGLPGIVGLHLEGPHLSPARKGAHDPALIRPMDDKDEAVLLEAAEILPVLKLTIAPESVSLERIARLAQAGIVLSLGHSDASFAECQAAADCGVRCVTHLFNAMSQLGNREPGLVGAALTHGGLSAGLIADLIHVHPQSISVALNAKQGPGRIFLVSDAMAPAGSDIKSFILNGRRVERRDHRLTLADGTLAGADLDMSTAIRNLVQATGTPLAEALAMATSVPAALIGKASGIGRLAPGTAADFIHLNSNHQLETVWQAGGIVGR